MAEKLSITIALNGAEEIKRQLAEVGRAGQDCFKDINDAAAEVGGFNKLDPSVVTEKIKNFGVTGSDAINKVNAAVKQAGRMESLVNGIAAAENGLRGMTDAVGLLIPSVRTMGRLLFAAVSAATVGAVVSTTKAIMELDAAAIKLGVSFQDLAKAENIFKAIGLSFKDAQAAARGFFAEQGKIELAGVKEAIANLDEFGRSASTAKDWFKILEEGAKSSNKEVADLAQNKLRELGRTVPGISAAAKEIEKIQQSALNTPDKILAIIAVLEKMGPTAERQQIANKLFGPEFTQALNAGGVQLEAAKARLASLPQPTKEAADAAALLSLEWGKLKQTLSIDISPEVLNAIALSLGQIRVAVEAVGAAFVAVNNFILSAFSGNLFANTIRELQTVIGWINKAIDAAKQLFGMGGGQATAGADAGGFARGGLMGGRGSGTSDSNLAWLSRGEHIMPANAVRQPGVLALLEALRRSGGNLRSVLDRMGHFAMGGLVGGAPAFAGGGVNGMNHVTIAFPGLPAVNGLRASSAVVDDLRRSAALAQVRSGGRKPSRYS